MADFEKTRLWKTSLGRQRGKDPHEKERERLRTAYFSFRENARLLAAEIPRDFAFLTVHDITHLDTLWEMADLITTNDDVLSPLEAFVLGGAFLIHDLGMGLAAYPEGFGELKKLPDFKDVVAALLTSRLGRQPSREEMENPDHHTVEHAKFVFIRNRHAARAEQLTSVTWKDKASDKAYYLLDDRELRDSLGPSVGKLAHSHWWPVSNLRDVFKRPLGAPVGFPKEWHIDILKLACVLRVADAAHIDARRAPSILKAFRNPPTDSAEHWTFQEHLHLPQLQQDYLVYTSGRPFTPEEAPAWWQCHDTLRMINRELHGVDALLVDLKRKRLAARSVAGVEDARRLAAEFIPTANWSPVDAHVKVTNVAGLVSKLAGEELYGRDPTVPLRELIQNSADAVRARRALQHRGDDWGDIVVRLGKDETGDWIEVQDVGVGMSEHVLTGPFLDFGSSLWSMPSVVQEFPTLLSEGFHSTGKYGIGFFSVFMWGERVTVTTRRFDDSERETKVLEFKSGLASRPLLRQARSSEILQDGGTKVRVWLKEPPDTKDGILSIRTDRWLHHRSKQTLGQICAWLCPTLDANLYVESGGKKRHVVKASDWKDLSAKKFLARVWLFESHPELAKLGEILTFVRSGDENVGRGCILPKRFPRGVITVGGLRSEGEINVRGVLFGRSITASRMQAEPLVSREDLLKWASEQAVRITSYGHDPAAQAECAMQIAALGGGVGDLPIAQSESAWLNSEEVAAWTAAHKVVLLVKSSALIDKYGPIRLKRNVLVEPEGYDSLIRILPWNWRWREQFGREPSTAGHPVVAAVAKAWSVTPKDVEAWSGEAHIGESAYGEYYADATTLKLKSVDLEE